MKNFEIAKIFFEIADILEMKNVEWKPQAYRRAAKEIGDLSEDVSEIYHKKGIKGLEEIPGIGEALAKKIIEYIETGRIKEYEKLKKSIPINLTELMKVPGMGPKRAKELYSKLKIRNIKELEKAAKTHKISRLEHFKEKTEENILAGIKLVRNSKGRFLLGVALPIAEDFENRLKKIPGVKNVVGAGSLRRMEETIGDIDILVSASDSSKVMNYFVKMPEVKRVLAKGDTKSMVLLDNNLQVDIRVIPEKSFGAALQYFTGNKEHNIRLREIAIKKGYKLSEYGLFRKNKYIAGRSEEEIYKKLGLNYIEPELRRNAGELELAKANRLPKVVSYSDIKGDLHVHSEYSDGSDKIIELANYAKNLDYEYICISDHSETRANAGGMDEKKLIQQLKEIDLLNKKFKNFRILRGIEVDILGDGSLDLSDELLKKLDIVTGSIHSGFKMTKTKMTDRIVKALENKYLTVFGHPTGRLINSRSGYEVELDEIFKVAKKNRKFMEINCMMDRLDLNAENIHRALGYGLKFVLGSDAHSLEHMKFMRFGVAQAKAGFATRKDILNCLSLSELKKTIKN